MLNTNNRKPIRPLNPTELMKSVFGDRARTNLLKKYEQRAITWMVQRIPPAVTSNAMTGIGFFGSIIVAASFMLAAFFSKYYLLLAIPGFMISWFGDSLDGRLAYYRNKPRKRYGFALDITIDWISIILIGFGYIIYAEGTWELLGYGFVVMYGWEMIIALMRYKITEKYSIDSGIFGPTEVRIIIAAIMTAEVFLPGSLQFSAGVVVVVLFFVNIGDTRKLLKVADENDKKEIRDNS
jgi:phosphatidylglycerophosphate synthase